MGKRKMTGQIGPHEGVEFDLFEAGIKHVIYFGFDSQPDGHAARARALDAMTLCFDEPGFNTPNVIYYRASHRADAEQLRELVQSRLRPGEPGWEANENEIGRILGYTEADVACFIRHFRAFVENRPAS